MAQYVVLEPDDGNGETVFVRDGFSLFALVLPIVWLVIQRLWLEAAAVIAVSVLLGFAGSLFGISDAVPLLALVVALFVALESPQWKIARLRRRGFVERAAIEAGDREEAEIRYFAGRVPVAVFTEKALPVWDNAADRDQSRAAYSSLGRSIGFVGHRGEN